MKVVISGYGKMGHMVEKVLQEKGIDLVLASEDIAAVSKDVAGECVCIDFTTPDAIRKNYPVLAANFKAVVIGTTGWNDIKDEVVACFEKEGTPLIYASNFSIGVNVLFAAVKRASELLDGHGYTPSIHEIHHIHKLDAPSGTAKSLGAIVEDGMHQTPQITAERIGEVPGVHTVKFLSGCDVLTLSHEAFSREGLAQGAVAAALMTEGLEGVHEFQELLFR